jgi:hypothetical protein
MAYNVHLDAALEKRVKKQVAKRKRLKGGCSMKQATVEALTAWVEREEANPAAAADAGRAAVVFGGAGASPPTTRNFDAVVDGFQRKVFLDSSVLLKGH